VVVCISAARGLADVFVSTLVSPFAEIFVSYEAKVDITSFIPGMSDDDKRSFMVSNEFIIYKEAFLALQFYLWLTAPYLNPPGLTVGVGI
jgi:hypothetical protein